MEITIKVDSMIDLITNSSTEIYTFPSGSAEAGIKKMVDYILSAAGTGYHFDDLFEIKVGPSQYAEDAFESWMWDKKSEELGNDRILNPIRFADLFKENPELKDKYWKEFSTTQENFDRINDEITIVTKQGADTGLATMIQNIFDTKSEYNG